MIVSERSQQDLLEASIQEIVPHTIDNGTQRDMPVKMITYQ